MSSGRGSKGLTRRASFTLTPKYMANGATQWYHGDSWAQRPSRTTPGVPTAARSLERIERQTDKIRYLKAMQTHYGREVTAATSQLAQLRAQRKRLPPGDDRDYLDDDIREAQTALSLAKPDLARVTRELARLQQHVARNAVKYRQRKTRASLVEELKHAPPRGAFPGGAAYRNAAAHFAAMSLSGR